MAIKVCKFGGTSMADGTVMNQVKKIIESDKDRKYIVVSAPGKRYSGDIKITDVLYECHKEVEQCGVCGAAFGVCASFGTAGAASAPGQPDAAALRAALQAQSACGLG